LDGLGGKFRGAIRLASQFGLAIGGVQIIRSSLKVITDFDQAVTDLGAISGKTADELKPLNDQAKELGATTQFTASEITGLQIELAKLGFTTQEISDSTGGIANFAAATGVEIPRAAALAGSALRAFGLETSEIDRVVSTLGVATTKTALDFSKLEAGLSTVAPVAASFGFSIEDTTALLGQLSNAGFDASSAATATRNILLNLADSGGGLAQALGRPVTNAKELAEGLAELKASGIDLAGALELTDKRSVAAFNTFLENADTLPQLTDSITDVNDELTDMADKRLDSVQGQLKLLNSAWEGFILGTGESAGAVEFLKNAIGFLAKNLTTIISVIGKLLAIYTIWIVRQKVINSGLIDYVKQSVNANTATQSLSRSQRQASINARNFAKTLKGIGWTALIAVVFELATAFYDIASGARAAREEQELFKKDNNKKTKSIQQENEKVQNSIREIRLEVEKGLITEEEANEKILELYNKRKKEIAKTEAEIRDELLKTRVASEEWRQRIAGVDDSIFRDLADSLSVLNKANKEVQATLDGLAPYQDVLSDIDKLNEELRNPSTSNQRQREIRREIIVLEDMARQFQVMFANTQDVINVMDQMVNSGQIQNSDLEERVVTYREQLDLLKTSLLLFEEQSEQTKKAKNNEFDRVASRHSSVKLAKDELKLYKDLIETQRELFERQIEGSGDEESIIRLDADKQIAELEAFKNEYLRAKKEMLGEDATLNETELAQFKDLREQIDEELRQSLLKMNTEKRKASIQIEKEIAENELTILENRMNTELSKVKGMDEKAVAERNAIRFKYMKQRAQIIGEITAKEIEALDNEIAYWKESGKPLAEEKIEALEQQKEIARQNARERGVQLQEEREEVQQTTDAYQNMANTQQMINDAFRLYSDERIKMLDREIEKIDELVNASKDREKELSELRSKEGADVAESLAFEQEKQAEALARKQELERKKRRTELATAVVNLVSAKIEQGSTNPTGEAFTEIAAIQGFIQSLPQFWEGTDTTVGDKLGMKYSNERDGVIARIDPSEMVLNKDKVDSLRGMGVNSTDDIVNVAKMWKSSNAIQSSNDFGIVQMAKPQFDSKGIEKELSQLKTENSQMKGYLKELSNRPSHVFEGKMMNDYFDFIEKKISNNKEIKTYRRFR